MHGGPHSGLVTYWMNNSFWDCVMHNRVWTGTFIYLYISRPLCATYSRCQVHVPFCHLYALYHTNAPADLFCCIHVDYWYMKYMQSRKPEKKATINP